MAKNSISKISNAFSTGGGGVNFEQQIQAMFLLSLLIDGFCPAMNEQTKKVHFQAKHLGYDVDDLVVITYRNQSEGKMACQIKHSITATEKDKTFQEVICAAWNDFNKEDFDRDRDRIALVTAQISNKAQQSLRFLHAEAIGSIDAEVFKERIDMPVFSNDDNKKMLAAIKECISLAKGSEPTNEEVWKFCKVFILLLFDMDCAESVNRALSASLIKCNSPENPILVWSRLVEYAGQCNQTAAFISKENIDRNIRDLFSKNNIIQLPPDPITAIDLFIPTIALIGAWKEDNEFDCKMIEQISGMGYSEFEARARTMLSQNSEYLQLTNGNWKVCHKEELLDQCKNKLFDDSIGKLLEAVESILRQKSKCVASKMPYFIPVSGEYDNSLELRGNLVKSLCWVKKNLSELSQCNQEKIKNNIYALVSTLLQDAKWITWTSLRDCLPNLAELSPEAFLKEAERGIINNPTEIVNLFPPKSGELSGINYISNLLWALEILAWSPEYLVHSISVLGLLEALPYERTNWTNTPINSIVSILLPWYPQAMYEYNGKDGLVIGLFGKWGTGKTSVINMAVNEITELAKNNENKPIIMKFAPWNYSDKDNLISMFFQSLKNKINVQDNEELKNKVGKALSDYAGAFDALSLVPVVGSGVAATILKTLALAKGADLMEGADLDKTRKILEETLIQVEKKIIIVIDDIDRLTNSQIRDVFQLVKRKECVNNSV